MADNRLIITRYEALEFLTQCRVRGSRSAEELENWITTRLGITADDLRPPVTVEIPWRTWAALGQAMAPGGPSVMGAVGDLLRESRVLPPAGQSFSDVGSNTKTYSERLTNG